MIVLWVLLNGGIDCLLREMNSARKYLVRKIYFRYDAD
jgi:hypothetical protein